MTGASMFSPQSAQSQPPPRWTTRPSRPVARAPDSVSPPDRHGRWSPCRRCEGSNSRTHSRRCWPAFAGAVPCPNCRREPANTARRPVSASPPGCRCLAYQGMSPRVAGVKIWFIRMTASPHHWARSRSGSWMQSRMFTFIVLRAFIQSVFRNGSSHSKLPTKSVSYRVSR